MHGGKSTLRSKFWWLAPWALLFQLNQCTPDQQSFLRDVQSATETFAAGLVGVLFTVIQNRDGDDIPGVDSVTGWVVNNVSMLF
jgi:hypothetical protein